MRRRESLKAVFMLFAALFLFWAGSAAARSFPNIIVRAEWLASCLGGDNLRIIDVRSDVKYREGHIPTAIRVDLNRAIKTKQVMTYATVPAMRRLIDDFEEVMGRKYGIRRENFIVIYDDDMKSAPRMLWELHRAGAEKVAVLLGGYRAWLEKRYPVSKDPVLLPPAIFVAKPNPDVVATASYVAANIGNPDVLFIDARIPQQFTGDQPGTGCPVGGHIPQAINLPLERFFDRETRSLKSPAEICEILKEHRIPKNKEIVVYCRSGHRAAVVYLVLKAMGYPAVRLYDGSWLDWSKKGYPVEGKFPEAPPVVKPAAPAPAPPPEKAPVEEAPSEEEFEGC